MKIDRAPGDKGAVVRAEMTLEEAAFLTLALEGHSRHSANRLMKGGGPVLDGLYDGLMDGVFGRRGGTSSTNTATNGWDRYTTKKRSEDGRNGRREWKR